MLQSCDATACHGSMQGQPEVGVEFSGVAPQYCYEGFSSEYLPQAGETSDIFTNGYMST